MKVALVCSIAITLLLGFFSSLEANVTCKNVDCGTRCVACQNDIDPFPTPRCESCPSNAHKIYGDNCIEGQCAGICTYCKNHAGKVYMSCNMCPKGDAYSPA